ncbi:MAG: phosphoribosylamine--glycine ligase [Anaerolineae bacterium]
MPHPDSTVLIVGSGGREHALAWSLARSPSVEQVLVAPGNGGTALEPKVANVDIGAGDREALTALALERGADLVVIGPEDPLAAGIVDEMRAAGLRVFGPTAAAARLESSKVWAREFMERHGVPHPPFFVADDPAAAAAAVDDMGGCCVVKADGLAAGKGVIVCGGAGEALGAVDTVMVERKYGDAGNRVLVEALATGPELSLMAATDGEKYTLFPAAQDYKRLLDGDAGPNTGGMGSYSPPPIATEEVIDRVRREVIEPTIAGMAAEGCPFTGCLYCGIMLTDDGPIVIEFNVRFGDPETQAQLPLVGDSLCEVLFAAAQGDLAGASVPAVEGEASVCVVLASEGYPERYDTGYPVLGVAAAESLPGVTVFHAGTRDAGDDRVVTSGGRALNVVCVADTLAGAAAGAYGAIGPEALHFANMGYRRDIAARAMP